MKWSFSAENQSHLDFRVRIGRSKQALKAVVGVNLGQDIFIGRSVIILSDKPSKTAEVEQIAAEQTVVIGALREALAKYVQWLQGESARLQEEERLDDEKWAEDLFKGFTA